MSIQTNPRFMTAPVLLAFRLIMMGIFTTQRSSAQLVFNEPGFSETSLVSGAPFRVPGGIAFAPNGDLFVVDAVGSGFLDDTISRVTPDGTVSSFFRQAVVAYFTIGEIYVDAAGDIYVWTPGDTFPQDILKLSPAVTVGPSVSIFKDFPSVAGGGTVPITTVLGMAYDSAGNLFTGPLKDDQIFKITPSGVSTTFLTAADVPGGLDIPTSLDFDPNGNLVIADYGMRRLIEVSPSKDINVLTSDLGFDCLQVQLAIHPISGDKFIRADADSILKIDYSGNVTTLATGFTDVFGLAFGPSTSGKGISLFAVDAGSTLTVIDGDVIYEIVPEPASVMMIAAGGILLLQRRRCSMRSSSIGSVKPSRL